MYLAPKINEALENNKHKFLGSNSYRCIVRRLGMSFEFPKDLKFRVETFSDIESNDFTVAGLYDMTTDKKYIILNLSEFTDYLYLDKTTFPLFKFFISQAIQHETIHQLQWQHRDEINDPVKLDFRNFAGTLDEEREYLSDIDEIDAYAHDIAMELKEFYPNKNPYEQLKKINRLKKLPSYSYYTSTFKNCNWQKVKNRLLFKTYKWIPHV